MNTVINYKNINDILYYDPFYMCTSKRMFLDIIKEILPNLTGLKLKNRNQQHIKIVNLLMLYTLFNNKILLIL